MARIKICGLTRREDAFSCNRALPDFAGFVFAPGSKRRITKPRAKELRELLNPRILTVGVFVNAPPEDICSLCREGIIDIIQLHGQEGEEELLHLRKEVSVPIIQAFGVQTRQDIERARRSIADFPLLDTQKAGVFGGTGEVFDWSLLASMDRPYFLAGGLHEKNLLQAAELHPYCLDVSSGAETDGTKDGVKIERLVSLVRSDEHGKR